MPPGFPGGYSLLMVELVTDLSQALQTGGPWALLVVMGIAYWRKDQSIRELHRSHRAEIIELLQSQRKESAEAVAAVTLMKDTAEEMKEALLRVEAR